MIEMAVAGHGLWIDENNSKTKPPAELLPTRTRGRISLLANALAEAMQRALSTIEVETGPAATVFASAFGETGPLLDLLSQATSENGELSPLLFMYSVHNSASGCLSIAMNDTGFSTSIAAGEETFLSGLFESFGLLEDGWDCVTLICGDQFPPEFFTTSEDSYHTMASAFHFVKPETTGPRSHLPRISLSNSTLSRIAELDTLHSIPKHLLKHPGVSAYQLATLLKDALPGHLYQADWGPWIAEFDPKTDQ